MAGKREDPRASYRGGGTGRDSRPRSRAAQDPYYEEDRRHTRRAYDYEEEPTRTVSRRSYEYEDGYEAYDRRASSRAPERRSPSGDGRGQGGGRRPPSQPPRGNGRKKKKRRMPGWQKAIIIILLLVILLMATAVGVVWVKLGHIERIRLGNESRTEEDFEVDDPDSEDTISSESINFADPDKVHADEDVINILLIGRDSRGSDRGRSDSMILVSLNRRTQQISMVSLMRDCYVQIPGYSNNKLNSAFSFGGYELMDQTVSKNFGIEIDYNVGVNFDGFEQVVDQLGGIDVTLTQAEVEYLTNDIYTNASGLHEGVNHLDGHTALSYARARYVGTGKEANDFGRTYRQRVVLTTVYKEMMKKPLTEIWTILDSIMDCIETDMSNTEIISLGTEFYNMGIDDLQNYRLPQNGEYTDEKINKMAVLVLDWDAARQHLQDWLYSDTPVEPHGVDAAN